MVYLWFPHKMTLFEDESSVLSTLLTGYRAACAANYPYYPECLLESPKLTSRSGDTFFN
jgi:hypothetical protein